MLLQLLRKTFQAALNASPGGLFEDMRGMPSLVRTARDLLCRVIHEGGSKAGSTLVSPSTTC